MVFFVIQTKFVLIGLIKTIWIKTFEIKTNWMQKIRFKIIWNKTTWIQTAWQWQIALFSGSLQLVVEDKLRMSLSSLMHQGSGGMWKGQEVRDAKLKIHTHTNKQQFPITAISAILDAKSQVLQVARVWPCQFLKQNTEWVSGHENMIQRSQQRGQQRSHWESWQRRLLPHKNNSIMKPKTMAPSTSLHPWERNH